MDNMKILAFKTNINCSGCIAAVKPLIDSLAGHDKWKVDTENKDKILTVEAEGVTEKQLIEVVQQAGYKIEIINS
ncbi:MAG: heavy-metal-associated domain-containing protein [Bacteroidia bacterium]|nr:heavy-metal-associated domain-containing protein [Bacteroidia bacterium]MCZ2277765.1 heavy-metal-associated domain-containing protein [Bacteroidia bacterium]